jgi:hypothetical protein
MRIRIARTREDQKPGERNCAICQDVFWLGEATAWAITDANALILEVCPACLEGGASHIEAMLEEWARLSRVIVEQDERIASESVEDVPSVDELPVAETFFYGDRGERLLPRSPCPGDLRAASRGRLPQRLFRRGIMRGVSRRLPRYALTQSAPLRSFGVGRRPSYPVRRFLCRDFRYATRSVRKKIGVPEGGRTSCNPMRQ